MFCCYDWRETVRPFSPLAAQKVYRAKGKAFGEGAARLAEKLGRRSSKKGEA